jgi:hypothetical protein
MFITCSYVFSKDGKDNIVNESVAIVRKLKDKDLKTANVILDVIHGEVLKCRTFSLYGKIVNSNDAEPPSYQRLLDHFNSQHPEEVGVLLNAIQTMKK